MANVNARRGFTPVKYRGGKHYNGAGKRYYKSASVQIGIGDPVVRVPSTDANGEPEVTVGVAGAIITGICVGIDPIRNDLTKLCMLAGDVGYLYVEDSPDVLFQVQDDGSAVLGVASIGEEIDMIAMANCDSTTGRSKMALNASAVGDGKQFRIEGAALSPDNDPTIANAQWLVSINLTTENTNGAASLYPV